MSEAVSILLCVDGRQQALLRDTAILDDRRPSWLAVEENAWDARKLAARSPQLEEVWVFSSEEVEGINLAAALKADAPACRVYLAGCVETGSVRSRLMAADLDGVLTLDEVGKRIEERFEGTASKSEDLPSPSDASESSEGNGFLLTVVSGSGGAGKSTVSAVLAHLGARRGLSVALVDADLQFGDLRDVCASVHSVALDEIAKGDAELPPACPGEVVLVGAPRRLELSEVLSGCLGEVVDAARSRFDLIVANTGGSWTEQHVQLLERSAAAVFLVDQRASSVRACRHALDLCLRCGIATSSFLLALNRCTRHAPLTSIDVSSALQGAHVAELADGGREVEELLGSGMADQLISSGNELCSSVDRLLDELLPASILRAGMPPGSGSVARFGARGGRARGSRRSRGPEERFGRLLRKSPSLVEERG